jgi:hypothetical protein
VSAQLGRIDVDRQSVEVGKEKKAFRLVLHAHPSQDCAEKVSKVKIAGRLNA